MCWNGAYYGTAALCNFQTLFAGGGTNLIDAQGVLIAAFSNLGTANNNSGAMNGTTMVTPIFQNVGGLSNPTADFLGGSIKDFQNGTQSIISMYGANHVYFAVAPVQVPQKWE